MRLNLALKSQIYEAQGNRNEYLALSAGLSFSLTGLILAISITEQKRKAE